MTWIQTHTGAKFDLLDPDPGKVRIEDVAYSLFNIRRFTGHAADWWTDGHHSMLVCRLCPSDCRLEGLLHDAHEVYTGDQSSPMKAAVRAVSQMRSERYYDGASDLDVIERQVQSAVAEAFGLTFPYPSAVKEADDTAFGLEMITLFDRPPLDEWIERLSPTAAKAADTHPDLARAIVESLRGSDRFTFLKEFERLKRGFA